MKVKKRSILLLIIVICVSGVAGFIASLVLDRIHFGDDIIPYTDTKNTKSSRVYIDYDKSTFHIDAEDVGSIYKTLMRGNDDMRRLFQKPDRGDESIKIRFASEIKVIVTPVEGEEKACYISYTEVDDRKTKYYYLKGYDSYEWLLRIIQANMDNEVVREK